MTLIIRIPYTHGNKLIPCTINGFFTLCNASVPELIKTTHVIDKLLSGESTVLTRGRGGTPYLRRKACASEI